MLWGPSIRIQSGANGSFGAIKFRFQQGVYSSRLDSMSSLSCRRLTFNLSRSFARPSANFSSSSTGFAQVSVETDANGIATVSMNKAPVNSLNTEFIQELTQAVVDTEKAAKVTFVDFSTNI